MLVWNMFRLPGLLLISLLALLVSCSRQPVHSPPVVQGQYVVVDGAQLTPDIPQFFTYTYNGGNISFFVIKLDQKIVSFLDACASCYRHKQGYRYDKDDDVVTCRYCNMQFSIYKLEKGLGGCYPIRIDGRMEGGKYLIPLKALQSAADKF